VISGDAKVLCDEGRGSPARQLGRGITVMTVKNGQVLQRTIIDGLIESSTRRVVRLYVMDGGEHVSLDCTMAQRFGVPGRRRPEAADLVAGDAVYRYDGVKFHTVRIYMISIRQERDDVAMFVPKLPPRKRFIANGFICEAP
jgi:hypothetical protein